MSVTERSLRFAPEVDMTHSSLVGNSESSNTESSVLKHIEKKTASPQSHKLSNLGAVQNYQNEMLLSSLRRKTLSNVQSANKISSLAPESERKNEDLPRIRRLCNVEDKDEIESNYPTETQIIKAM